MSAFGIVLAAPIVAFTALIIKVVSPGPVFFRQERVGLNGEIFDIYKLRTMQLDAEKDTGPVWAREDDPRLGVATADPISRWSSSEGTGVNGLASG
jgi:lipopolysaccharide/colanic/teichoic acid biosynthesis glycosyltransferase